jgi:zinc protease
MPATTGGIAGTLLRTVQRGFPLNWIDDYSKSVNEVTLEQVNSAIKRYVDPKKLVIVKAGTIGDDRTPLHLFEPVK